ncbi:hypothetical protein CLOACE_22190 [Clostridium acetireducens DSM 10703]|uniref:Uncharacterized protein n=1 Tax=Clostridium acetireducens DSM 10703 TaxID=1121290 RepID=A0A1E8EVD5_9CLOT|nr:hypothetical protein [Clostridium acetireducens]OFH99485.1 hypothetical protein CLOACE_22190 [Clostridium acetireducens DSM 10703]
MNNNEKEILEKILRELQDIKVILQEHCTENEVSVLKDYINNNK